MDSSPVPTPVAGMSGDTAARIAAFLDAHHVMSLATCGAHGPHAANLLYARDGFVLVWVSAPRTRHSAELEANPHVSATVAPDTCDFDLIRGLQVSGDAHRIVEASERHLARALLEARYPSLQSLFEGSPIRQAYNSAELYRLVPRRMVIIDNKHGFGHKDVLEFGAPAGSSA
jgi:uncharacterized protein